MSSVLFYSEIYHVEPFGNDLEWWHLGANFLNKVNTFAMQSEVILLKYITELVQKKKTDTGI